MQRSQGGAAKEQQGRGSDRNRHLPDVWLWRPGSLRLLMAAAEGPDYVSRSLLPSASLSTPEVGYFTEGYLSTMKYGLSLHAGTLEDL